MKARKQFTGSEVEKLLATVKAAATRPATGAGELPC